MTQMYTISCQASNDTNDDALTHLNNYISSLDATDTPPDDFQVFEDELKAKFDAAQRQVLANQMSKADCDAPLIFINGLVHRRAGRWSRSYINSCEGTRLVVGSLKTVIPS